MSPEERQEALLPLRPDGDAGRLRAIQARLGCAFVTFNPNSERYNVGDTIN